MTLNWTRHQRDTGWMGRHFDSAEAVAQERPGRAATLTSQHWQQRAGYSPTHVCASGVDSVSARVVGTPANGEVSACDFSDLQGKGRGPDN